MSNNITDKDIQHILNKTLQEKGITQVFLAKRSGVTPQTINNLFRKTPKNLAPFLIILDILGLTVEDFKKNKKG